MILIIGGANQGKLKLAKTLADVDENSKWYADGREDSIDQALKRPVIYQFHRYIKRLLEESKSIELFLGDILEKNPEVVIVTEEIGCGIVPVCREERVYREEAGRAAQKIAASSHQVYRVICGIGSRIK